MLDSHNREIDYLRVSITDRCNLRCKYCMPEDLPSIPHDNVMRYEEILRICRVMAGLGIHTIKVTGGEPLVRKGCVDFVRKLKAIPGIRNVTLTTNAIALEQQVDALAEIGLDGVNVSLDTLEPSRYQQLTGFDGLEAVLSAVDKAVAAGLRVKVNCVPLLGVNENEIAAIAGLAQSIPVDVRFIELMPTLNDQGFQPVPGHQLLEALQTAFPDLQPDHSRRGFGPAQYYRSEKLTGRIGFINALSGHFCGGCNRIRLTSEGFLKLCLYHEQGLDLRELLRGGAEDAALSQAIQEAVDHKPERHFFGQEQNGIGIANMSRIGG